MALQDTSGILLPPQPSSVTFANMLLDAAAEKAAFIIPAPKTGIIDRVCFRTSAVTTATDTDVRIETIDTTTGNPSGTLWGANTNGTVPAASITANTWIEATMTAGATVNRGDMIAVVIAPTGTPNYNVARIIAADVFVTPYTALFTGSWAKSTVNVVGAVRYTDGTYPHIPGVWPISDVGMQNMSSTTSPDEVGNLVNLPFSCSVSGLIVDTNSTSNAADLTCKIYNSANTVLTSITYDFSLIQGAGICMIRLPSVVTLTAGTNYRIAVEAVTTTVRAIKYSDVANTTVRQALPADGSFVWTQRTDGGAWTETATRRAGVGIVVSQLDDGAGAGGGSGSAYSYGFVG